MTQTNQNPWDSPLFRRPSTLDFNNCQKQNDPNAAPPNPTTDPNAQEYNTMQFAIVAIAQMVPTAIVCVSGGPTPSISSVLSPVDTLNGNISAFTLTRISAGKVWVELTTATPTNNMPAVIGQPTACLNVGLGTHNYAIGAVYGSGPAFGNQAVEVTTVVDATLTDLNFTVTFQ